LSCRRTPSQSSGYITLEGDPGLGKTSILSEYVRRSGCIAHFNVRGLGITSAAQFLENVCGQLVVDAGLSVDGLTRSAMHDGGLLETLIAEAARRLPAGDRLIIAVDALDEVDSSGQPDGANILFLPPDLPERAYFVLTRRRVKVQLVTSAPQQVFDLMAHSAENRADVEAYLHAALARPGLRDWAARGDYSSAEVVEGLADRSESNFMYLHHVLPALESGAYTGLTIDHLPVGLEGYYEDHWRRMGMDAKPVPRDRIRIIYVLCEARQPVSRALLTQLASDTSGGIDEVAVQEVLDEWSEFLHPYGGDGATRYSLYHTSFRDFLHRRDIVQAAGVEIATVNTLIVDALWDELYGDG
jgi:hypothetical protein